MEPEVLADSLSQMDALRHALGHFLDTPLGEAAEAAVEAQSRRTRRTKAQIALDNAAAHLNGGGIPNDELEAARRDPTAAGRQAAARGFSETRNPFSLGSSESAQWMAGFKNATDERRLSEGAASSPFEDDELPPAA
jgi:hypothetical protein